VYPISSNNSPDNVKHISSYLLAGTVASEFTSFTTVQKDTVVYTVYDFRPSVLVGTYKAYLGHYCVL